MRRGCHDDADVVIVIDVECHIRAKLDTTHGLFIYNELAARVPVA